jgi:hypothetical protein
MACAIHGPRCRPGLHSPGGSEKGTEPFRPGKTRRDHESDAWARRLANRVRRASVA